MNGLSAGSLLAAREAYLALTGHWRLHPGAVTGIERGGCGGCPIAADDHIVGEIDESTASWFGQWDCLVGCDLAWTCPGHALIRGDAISFCNLGFSLGAWRSRVPEQ
jgi:hypothetical protein